jgi:Zn-dependent M28 family amino/carboxypeptidase
MATRLYKTYTNLTNIIVRLSDGTDAGKEHALLINSHIDSPISSPGAADDALAVSVMLDCMRVLLDDETWSPSNAVVFRTWSLVLPESCLTLLSVFNNAEETLQDASQLFCTQHDIAST